MPDWTTAGDRPHRWRFSRPDDAFGINPRHGEAESKRVVRLEHPRHAEPDPQAYRSVAPIEPAADLQDQLRIMRGIIDANVFFKSKAMLTQKLIELRKDPWSIAPYRRERHGFTHPDAGFDEYRRIRELFQRALGR